MTDVVQLDFDRIQVYNPAIGRWKLGLGSPLEITVGDTGSADAFNRLRTSNPETLLEVQNQYNTDALRMEVGASGSGVVPAHNANTRMVLMQINAGGAGTSFCQSFAYIPYQPGKSQLILMTGVMGASVAGAVKRFGYGDNANGIFYEQNGTNGVQFTLLDSTSGVAVAHTVAQANWNLDTLDGKGPSQIILNQAACFILVIDLQYLGMGRVRCGFEIDGRLHYAHEFKHANTGTAPYMQSATLPIKAEIIAAAALASAVTSHWKCGAIISEGGIELSVGRIFSTEGIVTAASGARTHILSLRPRLLFNGLPNRGLFILEGLEILAGSNPILWELVIGAVFTVAPGWADVNSVYSFIEKGTVGTFNHLNNGIVIAAGYVTATSPAGRTASSRNLAMSYPITLNRAGAVRDLGTLSVLLTGIGGTSASRVSLHWREVR